MKIQPKGARVLIKVLSKPKEDQTSSGIFLASKGDSHDNALLFGVVEEVGFSDVNAYGVARKIDVEIGAEVYFNRYNAYRVKNDGLTEYYLVECVDIWGAKEKND